uniref:Alpha/beta hydrolase fold-3 domain-containing protein n=1 Tax=Leersia perrieri TaxID=77586 RepID=A0A0D9WVT1_9ORYZ
MSPAAEPYVVENIRGAMQLMSDGTVRRAADAPAADAEHDGAVEWRDVTWHPGHDLNARIYRPRHLGAANDARVPVVAGFHAWCLRLAGELPAVVLSFDYRLAPEHRLPSPHEDGAAAMAWARNEAARDPWLADAADFSRFFVAGDSAGGNIAHHVGVSFGRGIGPDLRLRGLVLLMPAMAGETRTRAELDGDRGGAFLTAEMSDRYARLLLPEGATRDHPLLNIAGPEATGMEAAAMAPAIVVAAGRDILRDRNAQYARRMKEEWGKEVEFVEFAGEEHCFFVVDPWSERADELVRLVRKFVVEHMDS